MPQRAQRYTEVIEHVPVTAVQSTSRVQDRTFYCNLIILKPKINCPKFISCWQIRIPNPVKNKESRESE